MPVYDARYQENAPATLRFVDQNVNAKNSPTQGVDVVTTTGELLTRKRKFLAVPLNETEQEKGWSRDCVGKDIFQPGSWSQSRHLLTCALVFAQTY